MTEKFTNIEKKQIPFATMTALNNLAFATMNEHKNLVEKGLNWRVKVPNASRVKKATKKNLEAEVYIPKNKKNWGYYALKQHYLGNGRSAKGLETWLKENGFLSENDFLIVPKNGKTTRGASKMIINDFKKKIFNRFFIVNNSKIGKSGIYAKAQAKRFEGKFDTRGVIMLFKIIRKPTYKKRFDFEATVKQIWQTKGDVFFNEAMSKAIETAK